MCTRDSVPVIVQKGVSLPTSMAFMKSLDPQNSTEVFKNPIITKKADHRRHITTTLHNNKLYLPEMSIVIHM